MNRKLKTVLAVCGTIMICGATGKGCWNNTPDTAASNERSQQDIQMENYLRNQPVPNFNWSLERHMLIQIYQARQKATNTFSFVQSDYTGKILWSCNSIGFPIPYSTQLTNPQQVIFAHHPTEHDAAGVVAQQEPNGLYSPSQSDATWVPCLDSKGKIAPRYEEKHVSVTVMPMIEKDGQVTEAPGSTASLTIDPKTP